MVPIHSAVDFTVNYTLAGAQVLPKRSPSTLTGRFSSMSLGAEGVVFAKRSFA